MVSVIVLIGGFAAKTVLLKPKPLTTTQVAAAAKLADVKLQNLCASHNDLPSQPLPGDRRGRRRGRTEHHDHDDRSRLPGTGRPGRFARRDHDQPRRPGTT